MSIQNVVISQERALIQTPRIEEKNWGHCAYDLGVIYEIGVGSRRVKKAPMQSFKALPLSVLKTLAASVWPYKIVIH